MDEELNQNQTNNQNQNDPMAQADNNNNLQPTEGQQQEQQPQEQETNGVEVDPAIDSGDQVAAATQMQQQSGSVPFKMPNMAPVPPGAVQMPSNLELADGTNSNIAKDSKLQVDAINYQGNAEITFQNGNFNQLNKSTEIITEKITIITKTIIPLIEAGLIELLGNNKAYIGDTFNSTVSMDSNNTPMFSVIVEYSISNWIGTDIAQEDIMQDANYMLSKLKLVPNVQWKECSIDCTSGKFRVVFLI